VAWWKRSPILSPFSSGLIWDANTISLKTAKKTYLNRSSYEIIQHGFGVFVTHWHDWFKSLGNTKKVSHGSTSFSVFREHLHIYQAYSSYMNIRSQCNESQGLNPCFMQLWSHIQIGTVFSATKFLLKFVRKEKN
jgi:hypothetical protein